MENLTQGQELLKKLGYEKKNVYESASDAEIKTMFDYAEGYKKYLDNGKTEREVVTETIKLAELNGYKPYTYGEKLVPGDKRYVNNRGKAIYLFRIGSRNIAEDGIRISASHIDSPRLDLKQNPLYEDSEMSFLKTHYYGGIKKYQWVATPLAIHGVVALADGSNVDIVIGEKDEDPVFYINDILPHLARDQRDKPIATAIAGEDLNVLVGGLPFKDEKVKDKIKLTVLAKLYEMYGIKEEDFLSAELSVVPAFKARDIGFDRALLGSYGHDDRVCSYPALTALFALENTDHTCMVLLADKEEIGSEGNTGMQTIYFMDLVDAISNSFGVPAALVRRHSYCLSADVTAAYDPNFASAFERRNSSFISQGTCLCKYTGSGGKGGSNDAHAEFIGMLRGIFDKNNVKWQTSELGKVDFGGGGTVAKYISQLNIDTIDIGVPVIAMHSPFEVISKADLYETHKALLAFFKD